ncbi:MAG: MGMT family protein [Candidatus Levybacteria bacterium]|nr:MGMT family protein [Candidatus Levybacteria bacterium]
MNSFDKVYTLVSKIPKGKVATYKQISEISGLSPRVVGFALHANKNPETVPCHRVINIKGQPAKGYAFGGKAAQIKRLRDEGIEFKNGRLDLEKYIANLY